MENGSYWQKMVWQRLSRRRALAATGAGVLGAAFLAACGGDDDGDGGGRSPTATPSGFTVTKVNSSSGAVRGGIYKSWVDGDEPNLDSLTNSRAGPTVSGPAEPANSRLFRPEEVAQDNTVTDRKPSSQVIVGDVASSWELPDDGLTLTVKVNPDAKFDPRAPTNGRNVTAEDLTFSMNKFLEASPFRSNLSNKEDPAVPLESVRKIDETTVQYKMAFPWAPLLSTLANGHAVIQPTEADGGFDARNTIRGSGPWMLDEYRVGVSWHWRKHPLSHRLKNEGVPYLDGWDAPILSRETRVAQLKAKGVWDFRPSASDLLALRKETPELQIYESGGSGGLGGLAFSSRPGSPFQDVRVRRALSMSFDRVAYGVATLGLDTFAKEGINLEQKISSHLTPVWGAFWLDPTTDQLGEGAKYLKHNITEAKALLAAAGQENLEFDLSIPTPGILRGVDTRAQIMSAMMKDAGVTANITVVDGSTVYLAQMLIPGPVKGDYDGAIVGAFSASGSAHAAHTAFVTNHSSGNITMGRKFEDGGMQKIDDIIAKATKEFDENKLKGLMTDFQKEQALYMSGVPLGGIAPRFNMVWPWVQNYDSFITFNGGRYNGGGGWIKSYLHTWIDESKMS